MGGHRRPVDPKKIKASRKRKPRVHHTGRTPYWSAADMPRIIAQVKDLVTKYDATDDDIADFYDMTARTLYRYKVRYPLLAQAMLRAEDDRVRLVEKMLIRSATGFRTPSVKIMQHDGVPILVEHEKFVEPSVPAQIAFLKAKRPKEYRDRIEHAGDVTQPVQFIIQGLYDEGEECGAERQSGSAG